MTDAGWPGAEPDETAGGEQPAALVALLRSASTWAVPAPHLEDAVVAAIRTESGGRTPRTPGAGHDRRSAAVGALLGTAAAVVLFLAAVALDVVRVDLPGGEDTDAVDVALTATADGPQDARADVAIQDRPDGLRILLEVIGLPPAPDGQWYEMSLSRPGGPAVSAGSFHLRGGGERVVLWAGQGIEPGLAVEISRQPEGTRLLAGAVDGGP